MDRVGGGEHRVVNSTVTVSELGNLARIWVEVWYDKSIFIDCCVGGKEQGGQTKESSCIDVQRDVWFMLAEESINDESVYFKS